MSETAIEKKDTGTDIAVPQEVDGMEGLEDFGSEDMVMPRLGIAHSEGKFVDNLTGEEFDTLRVVLLGLVKQRIMWSEEVEDGEGPLCKSYDFTTGNPSKDFPWKASGFEKQDGDDIKLPCESCALKEWGSHPSRKTPWCSEQYTLPLLMEMGEGNYGAPAILTIQRSGVKPVRSYLTGFKRSNNPLFTAVTTMSLDLQKKGSVTYSVPKFSKGEQTDDEYWSEYADHYRSIREFLTKPPAKAADDGGSGGDADNSSPAADMDDDDLPF